MIVRMGDRGEAVLALQSQLRDRGFLVGAVDGIFGMMTHLAVKGFQSSEGLVADGLAGPKTFEALGREGSDSKFLTDADYEIAAAELQIDQAVIRAIAEVESAGSGFMTDGRPRILFERHWMRRLLEGKGVDVTKYGEHLSDIINSTPGGYVGGAGEWDRLERAMAINRPIAIQSASWGKFQIMGFHWKRLGYSNVEEFHSCMCRNEGEHLLALTRFIKTDDSLRRAVQELDWKKVAWIYNGPNYSINSYDTKLEESYLRWKQKLA